MGHRELLWYSDAARLRYVVHYLGAAPRRRLQRGYLPLLILERLHGRGREEKCVRAGKFPTFEGIPLSNRGVSNASKTFYIRVHHSELQSAQIPPLTAERGEGMKRY